MEHTNWKEKILKEVSDRAEGSNIRLWWELRENCEREIDQLFETIKSNNEKNKKSWIRRVGGCLVDVAKDAAIGALFAPPGFKIIGAGIGALAGLIKGLRK